MTRFAYRKHEMVPYRYRYWQKGNSGTGIVNSETVPLISVAWLPFLRHSVVNNKCGSIPQFYDKNQ